MYTQSNNPFSRNKSNEPRKTTKGKGRNFRTVEEGAGMTEAGVADYKKKILEVNYKLLLLKKILQVKENQDKNLFALDQKVGLDLEVELQEQDGIVKDQI